MRCSGRATARMEARRRSAEDNRCSADGERWRDDDNECRPATRCREMGRRAADGGDSARCVLGHRARSGGYLGVPGSVDPRTVEHTVRMGRDIDSSPLQPWSTDVARGCLPGALCSGTSTAEASTSADWDPNLGASVLGPVDTGPNRAALMRAPSGRRRATRCSDRALARIEAHADPRCSTDIGA